MRFQTNVTFDPIIYIIFGEGKTAAVTDAPLQ
jgi:hypothetical protein